MPYVFAKIHSIPPSIFIAIVAFYTPRNFAFIVVCLANFSNVLGNSFFPSSCLELLFFV
jgi:hypothetical protein